MGENGFEILPLEDAATWRVIRRGGTWSFNSGGTLQEVRERIASMVRDDGPTIAAWDQGRFEPLCDLGWHRRPWREGLAWFRSGGWGPHPSFLVGIAPFRVACSKLGILGAPEPWRCADCGEEIAPRVG